MEMKESFEKRKVGRKEKEEESIQDLLIGYAQLGAVHQDFKNDAEARLRERLSKLATP